MTQQTDKDRLRAEREARLAENLRNNLRRRKAAAKKTRSEPVAPSGDTASESP